MRLVFLSIYLSIYWVGLRVTDLRGKRNQFLKIVSRGKKNEDLIYYFKSVGMSLVCSTSEKYWEKKSQHPLNNQLKIIKKI